MEGDGDVAAKSMIVGGREGSGFLVNLGNTCDRIGLKSVELESSSSVSE